MPRLWFAICKGLHLQNGCVTICRSLPWIAAAFAATPVAAQSQCLLCPTTPAQAAVAAPSAPLSIEIGSALDFDRVAPTAPNGGSVLVDPVNRTRVVSGALSSLGGLVMTGTATVRGEAGRAVRISMPQSVSLTSGDGTTARISRLVTDLGPAPRLGRDGSLTFAFGGTLDVTGNHAGDYRGRIPITVDYQ